MTLKLKEIYQKLITQGIAKDPRGVEGVSRYLQEQKKIWEELKEKEKPYFDEDRLFNPYSDSRILYGDGEQRIKTILCGIDVETQDLLLADRLRDKGEKIDLVLTHHPEGKALVALGGVMAIQEDILADSGVPIAQAQGLMAPRTAEIRRAFLPDNVQRTIDAARLLALPLMCMHTPADNQVQKFLETLMAENMPQTVGEVVDLLKDIPEYQSAMAIGAGPVIVSGEEKRRCGKILVEMTGGTSGPETLYEKLAQAGVGTIICMHISENHRKEAEKHHLNVIIAGHIASDSLGMNLLLDTLKKDGIKTIPFSGLYRIER